MFTIRDVFIYLRPEDQPICKHCFGTGQSPAYRRPCVHCVCGRKNFQLMTEDEARRYDPAQV